MSRDVGSRDFIKGINHNMQSYALTGSQWGDSATLEIRGKRATDAPPIVVSPQPPGAFAYADDVWKSTYGASQDAFLSLLNGAKLQENKNVANFIIPSDAVLKGLPSILTNNLYDKVNNVQQVQYVVSKNTATEAAAAQNFGSLADVRSIALRAPMQIAGWGHTVGMRPTDPEPEDKRLNDDEHKLDRSTWKQGPLDVRWDETRKCWRAWNDLIADNLGRDIGTFVHGTCNSETGGFPFQRGKLEDVWWIRTTKQSDAEIEYADGDDITKTAEVCTTLKHKLLDPDRNAAAPLWDVFVVHLGDEVTCGNETTKIGPTAESAPPDNVEGAGASKATLEIRTTAIFHYNDPNGGPLHFTVDNPFIEDDEEAGALKFIDGQWCPTINMKNGWKKITNLCAHPVYPFHTSRLTKNSEEVIEDGIFDLQRILCEWSEEYTECLLEHIAWNAANAGNAVWHLNYKLGTYIHGIANQLAKNILASVKTGIVSSQNNILGVINSLVKQIQACFSQLEITCPVELPKPAPPTIPPVNVEVDEFEVPGCPPPNCLIKSIAAYQVENGEELNLTIVNPCLGGTTYTGSCVNFGTPGGGGITIEPGKSFGGTDGLGVNNIAGKSFDDPSEEGGKPDGC